MSTYRIQYPRVWVHKDDPKKQFRVMPWWETVKDGEVETVDELGHMVGASVGRVCKVGVLVQVGYLLENEHGIWFGVGPKAAKSFNDQGEWVAPKKRKRRG